MNAIENAKFIRSFLLAGSSALALSIAVPAFGQESEEDAQRILGPVKVTTQKTEESIQDVPIAVSAFDENTLDKLQLAGGPDLVKSIPNVAFSKSNFTGYNFKIRGIGADVVAQSGDAGVGVHMNDVPLTGNRLFEAEFYDVERVETLRGPQGTLYGRNSTGGVINVITNKPVLGERQSFVRSVFGTYDTFKLKAMSNVPIGDKAAFRVAGSYLIRDGFADNLVTGNSIDDRDLYSIRATLAFEPNERLRGWMMFEEFQEKDNRIRAGKQLCKKDPGYATLDGISVPGGATLITSLGCQEASLLGSYDRVNSAATLGGGLAIVAGLLSGDAFTDPLIRDLRIIESAFDPQYSAGMTVYAVKIDYDISDTLTVTYTGSYSESSVVSKEDYNKVAPTISFNTEAGPFMNPALRDFYPVLFPGGYVTDPQLGRSNTFRTFDLSGGHSSQFSQELRLQTDFNGWLNFNAGVIKIDYEATSIENSNDGYYVFSNSLTALTQLHNAVRAATSGAGGIFGSAPYAAVPIDTNGNGEALFEGSLGGDGGNYFRSLSPYKLNSLAIFGEMYVDISDSIKFTIGLRVTDDNKIQDIYPSILFGPGAQYRTTGVQKVDFEEVTGRVGFDWKPNWSSTDETLFYAFYSKGYKGGGINPPQPVGQEVFPVTFEPEFVNSYEIGTKNTFNNGRLQFNATGFAYDYQGYQITQIINRTSANFNINAEIKGLEFETVWNPVETLIINSNIGILESAIKDTKAIDVLDRTNGNERYITIKNGINYSNCVISRAGLRAIMIGMKTPHPTPPANNPNATLLPGSAAAGICSGAFADNPATTNVNEEANFIGLLNPLVTAYKTPNNGPNDTPANFPDLRAGDFTPFEGFAKDLDGKAIPNAPELTWNLGLEYTWDAAGVSGVSSDWGFTARVDYYYQADSFSRVWNTRRDKLKSWENFNLVLRMEDVGSGLSFEFFGKNVTNEDVITGAYLTDDSSGLFTNIFLTDPATWGIAVSKSW